MEAILGGLDRAAIMIERTMLALPTPSPAQVVENEGELRVSMPPRRHWFIVGFLLVWLCGWAAGEAGVMAMLISGKTAGAPTRLLAAWLALWSVGGGLAVIYLLWVFWGREVVIFRQNRLVLVRKMGRFETRTEYDLARVRNFRCAAWTYHSNDVLGKMGRFAGSGTLIFDYGSTSCRFGAGLAEAEAHELVEVFRQRSLWN